MYESIGFLVHPRHNTITRLLIEMTESLGSGFVLERLVYA